MQTPTEPSTTALPQNKTHNPHHFSSSTHLHYCPQLPPPHYCLPAIVGTSTSHSKHAAPRHLHSHTTVVAATHRTPPLLLSSPSSTSSTSKLSNRHVCGLLPHASHRREPRKGHHRRTTHWGSRYHCLRFDALSPALMALP